MTNNITKHLGGCHCRAVRYPDAIGARCFCSRCGIHCFGRGHLAEMGGDFASVNLDTIDG